MTIHPVQLPSWDNATGSPHTLMQVDKWLGSQPMRKLVSKFGGNLPSYVGHDLAEHLDTFAGAHWDYRQGSERDAAGRVSLTPEQATAAMGAARELGMTDATAPRRDRYDAVLILGGMVRACIVRPRYAAQLIHDGLRAQELVALGAFRPLSDKEASIAAQLGVSARDEYEVMTHGIRRAFGTMLEEKPKVSGEDIPGDPFRSWRVTTWQIVPDPHSPTQGETIVSVAAAPSSQPDRRRANTADTYDYWADRIRRPNTISVLLITNPIYVVYQGCAAIQSLGWKHNLDVEIVGTTQQASDLGPVTQVWDAQDYLQEIRASIGALVRLRSSLAATT